MVYETRAQRRHTVVVDQDGDGDYNGTDEVPIQAAIDSGAKHIIISGDTYTINNTITGDSNIILQGSGRGTVLVAADSLDTNIITFTSKTKFKISDMYIDGNKANQSSYSGGIQCVTCTNFSVENVEVYDVYGDGIAATTSSHDFAFINCKTDLSRNDGILVHTSYNGNISDCIASGSTATGSNGFGVYSADGNAYNVNIVNCIGYDNSSVGFNMEYCHDCNVTNCVAYGNANGFACFNAGTYNVSFNNCTGQNNSSTGFTITDGCSKNKIANCRAFSNTSNGINIDGVTFCEIMNCHTTDNADGIAVLNACANIDVVGNKCHAEGDDGIVIDQNGETMDNINVTGNDCCDNTGDGIIIANSNTGTLMNVAVTGNTVNGNGGKGIWIRYAAGSHIAVTGNNSDTNTSYGIDVLGKYVSVSGNVCRNSQSDYTSGIVVRDGSEGVSITGNTCEFNNFDGIQILGDYFACTGNVCVNNGQRGSGSGIHVESNVIRGTIVGNSCFDTQGTKTQEYGVNISGTGTDWMVVTSNMLFENKTGAINGNAGANGVLDNNITI